MQTIFTLTLKSSLTALQLITNKALISGLSSEDLGELNPYIKVITPITIIIKVPLLNPEIAIKLMEFLKELLKDSISEFIKSPIELPTDLKLSEDEEIDLDVKVDNPIWDISVRFEQLFTLTVVGQKTEIEESDDTTLEENISKEELEEINGNYNDRIVMGDPEELFIG